MSILDEVFKGRVWSKVDKYGTETVGQKTLRTHKDSDVPNPKNEKNAVTTVTTTGRPDKRYPSHMRPAEMKKLKNEDFAMRRALIEAIIEAAYTPPPGLKPLKDKYWYDAEGSGKPYQDELATGINNRLFRMLSQDQGNPIIQQLKTPRDRVAVVRGTGRKLRNEFNRAFKAREGLLYHQAREAGYKPDPREIRQQASLMMPGHMVGKYAGAEKEHYDYVTPGSDRVRTMTPTYGFDPMAGRDMMRKEAQDRLRSQRFQRRMEKRGLTYAPAKKARFTRQMNLNRKGRRGTLPEWLEEEASKSRVNKAILKARKLSEKFIRKMEGKKPKKADDNERR